jgi:hypothetical protein
LCDSKKGTGNARSRVRGFFIAFVIAFAAQRARATRVMAPHCLAMDARLNLPIAELSRDVQTGSGLDARCAAQATLHWHASKAIPLLTNPAAARIA